MKIVPGALFIFGMTFFAGAALSQEIKEGRFGLHEGTLANPGEPQKITILIDRQTGQTWMLVVVETIPQWVPLKFPALLPPNPLPLLGSE